MQSFESKILHGVSMDYVDQYLTELEAVIHSLSRDDVRKVVEAMGWEIRRCQLAVGSG